MDDDDCVINFYIGDDFEKQYIIEKDKLKKIEYF